jgi:hypothetical protein
MVTLNMRREFELQETKLRKLDALVGTNVSVKYVLVTDLENSGNITVQTLSRVII